MKSLIGRTITAVEMDNAREVVRFVTDGTPSVVEFYCDGDCCSESWINHVSGLKALLGKRVAEFESIKLPDQDSARQDVDRVMLYRLKTDAGACDFEFRNASNGYYGGSLEQSHAVTDTKTTPVVEDF